MRVALENISQENLAPKNTTHEKLPPEKYHKKQWIAQENKTSRENVIQIIINTNLSMLQLNFLFFPYGFDIFSHHSGYCLYLIVIDDPSSARII